MYSSFFVRYYQGEADQKQSKLATEYHNQIALLKDALETATQDLFHRKDREHFAALQQYESKLAAAGNTFSSLLLFSLSV